VDIVVEATGNFSTRGEVIPHLSAGARKVVVTAPTRGEDLTVVMGVNDQLYQPGRHHLVSASSCTTNCLSPLVAVLHQEFGIRSGLMTTIHSYTRDQELLDGRHSDPRRARAANLNMCPTTTGSAKAVDLIFPELRGRIVGLAIRVPLPDVSLVDLSVALERPATLESINRAFIAAVGGRLKGILDATDEPLVSSDFHGDQHSAIVDLASTREAPDGHFKVLAWYDNEAGYAARVVDLVRLMRSGLEVPQAVELGGGVLVPL
jgi:glyceraldehyde 3-phosphate dehydrogenase